MKEYKEGSRFYDDLRRWHKKLEDQRDLRASLRQSSSLVDVYMSVGFRDLLKTVKYMDARNSESVFQSLAVIAGLASYVKNNDESQSFASQMGRAKQGQRPIMSELRFRRLMSIETPEALYRELRRAIKLADGSINLNSLANDVLQWFKEQNFKRLGRVPATGVKSTLPVRWSIEYYDAIAPNETNASEEK